MNKKTIQISIPCPVHFSPDFFAILSSFGNVQYFNTYPTESEMISRLRNANIAIIKRFNLSENILRNTIELKLVILPSVGVHPQQKRIIHQYNIELKNCPSYCTTAVAEFTVGSILSYQRKMSDGAQLLKLGKWRDKQVDILGENLETKIVGIIGYGRIGQRIHDLLSGFNVDIRTANSKTSADDIDTILKESGIIIISCALTPKTINLIDKRRINLIKASGVFVNIARGAIVDEYALLEALQRKRIHGAIIDVYSDEPCDLSMQASHLSDAFSKCENVIATPHMAYNSRQSKMYLERDVVQRVRRYCNSNKILPSL